MLKNVLGIVAGLAIWVVIVIALGICLRQAWPEYASVEKAMAFTVPMMVSRLSVSAMGSLVSGALAARIGGRVAALMAGAILFAAFVPIHYSLWARFPIWYHATFLLSLPVLSVMGGRMAARS